MAGYDLVEGVYDHSDISEEELWQITKKALSSKTVHTSTYKYAFFKVILDNLFNTDDHLRLSFQQLFSRFTEIYWTLVLKYRLKQGNDSSRLTYVEQILQSAEPVTKYQSEYVSFDLLSKKDQEKICSRVKNKCKTYVVGALYSDLNERLYSFSKKEEWIQLNPKMHEFLCRNKKVINQLICYEWASFLDKTNSDNTVIELTSELLSRLGYALNNNRFILFRQILELVFNKDSLFIPGNKATKSYEIILDKCEDALAAQELVPINTLEVLFDAEEAMRDSQHFLTTISNDTTDNNPSCAEYSNEMISMLNDPEALIKELSKKHQK